MPQPHMKQIKMSPEDRKNYLTNELEYLNLRLKRLKTDKYREPESLSFYIKVMEDNIKKIKEELNELKSV